VLGLCFIIGVLIFLIIVVIVVVKKKRRDYIINKPNIIENINIKNNEYDIIQDTNIIKINKINDQKENDNEEKEKNEKKGKEKAVINNKNENRNNKEKMNVLSTSAIKQINSQINTNYNSSHLNSERESEPEKNENNYNTINNDSKKSFKEIMNKNKKNLENVKKLIPQAITNEKNKYDRSSLDSNSSNRVLTNSLNQRKSGSAVPNSNNEMYKTNKSDVDRNKNLQMKINKAIKFDSGGINQNINSSPQVLEAEKILITKRITDNPEIKIYNNTEENLLTETEGNKNKKERKDNLDINIKNFKILNTLLDKANNKKTTNHRNVSNLPI